MKRLAGLFSVLTIALVLWGGWLVVRPEIGVIGLPPSEPEVAPQRPATPTPPPARPPVAGWPKLPPFTWPKLPDLWPKPAPPEPPRAIASPVQRILIEKAARRMTVWQKDGPEKTYKIALGFQPTGDKSRQGDGKTPEGIFHVDRLNPKSKFHLSLGLDYPQKKHRAAARRAGVDPGGDIMIHGQPGHIPDGYRVKGDWTEGCIAVADMEIDEIFAHTAIGTEVEIRP